MNKLDFLLRNWGNLASVAGLMVGIATVVFARRASSAAREAKKAVLSRTLAEEINQAQKLASEVSNLVELKTYERALIRCNDLMDATTLILSRWDSEFSSDSKNNYLEAKALIDSIHKVLFRAVSEPESMNPKAVLRLNDACRTVRTVLIEEHALRLKAIEGEQHEKRS